MNERIKRGVDSDYAWNETSIELVQASEVHCRAFIVETYYNTLQNIKPLISPQLGKVMTELCELYAVYTILRLSGDVLRVS